MKYSRFLTVLLLIGCAGNKSETKGWALIPFIKVDNANPVLEAGNNKFVCPIVGDTVKWDEKDVFNPATVVKDNKVYMIFRAEDKIGKYAGTSRLGLAVSDDGLHFTKRDTPVFYPDNDSMKVYEWEGGVEDPRVVENNEGLYVMTYTAYDGDTARLCVATSRDLEHWSKHGRVVNKGWSKSGAIVSKRSGEKIIAEKINGKYWMYWGDTDLFTATSDDLINWKSNFTPVLRPREKMFDSRLVESGPFALVTDKGILLLYNGMDLNGGAYRSGQALFGLNDPTKVIDRLDNYFMEPDKPYEINGQVNQVCFIEGMVPFKGKWFLYYGTADSKIAVATGPPTQSGQASVK